MRSTKGLGLLMAVALLGGTASSLLGLPGLSGISHAAKPDPELLKIRGYSPETVLTTVVQSRRQEWVEPPPPERTPWQQFRRNIYINDWTGNFDPFGSHIIRERQ